MLYFHNLINKQNNHAIFTFANIANKISVSPRIYFRALFVGMLEKVDPDKVYFKILNANNQIEPAVSHIIRRVANNNDNCALTIHDPRITTEDPGPYEAPEFITSYMNLIAMYLLHLDNPEINFNDFETTKAEIAKKIQRTMQFEANRSTVTVSITCSFLINILNSNNTKRQVAEFKQQSKNQCSSPSRCSIT